MGSAVFARLTIVIDRQTNYYSVRNDRPHTYVVLRCSNAYMSNYVF